MVGSAQGRREVCAPPDAYLNVRNLDQGYINVIASEATQSSFLDAAGMDCFVASTSVRKRLAFVAGNDADGLVRTAD